MKKTLLLLVVVALVGSVTAQADQFDSRASTSQTKKKAVRPMHQVVYITNVSVTGSHLPLTVTKYGNDVHANSSFIAYSAPQLDQTGQVNVGGQLNQRDPAISSVRGIH